MYKQRKTALGTQYEAENKYVQILTLCTYNKYLRTLLSLSCSPRQLFRLFLRDQ